MFDPGALPLNKARAFDTEYSTDNALPFNNSIMFLNNTSDSAGIGGGSISCQHSTIMFIGMMYFDNSYDSAVEGYSCNISFIGTTYFNRNRAQFIGGAIHSFDSNIMLSGTAYFERNIANYSGGAIALRNSKLVFKPNLNIFFISNYAKENGGAFYITDYRCSFVCFMTIDGPSTSISNISLHFENNSAGITGSILYGGQLDQCRLYFSSPLQ